MCVAAHTYESDKERERERERERFFLLLLFLQHAEEWILHRGGELGDCREELRLLFFLCEQHGNAYETEAGAHEIRCRMQT